MYTRILVPTFVVLIVSGVAAVAQVQQPAANTNPAAANEAARQQILQSDRWKNAVHGFEQWLSVQQLYSPQEVALLRSQFKSRVERMSPAELEQQLTRMEEKLAVLTSPEADDARRWLSQFLAVQKKYTDAELRRMRPDVAGMTAAQIREELARFQSRRGQVQGVQSATQQARSLQVQSAQNIQATRRQAEEAARKQATQAGSTAATFPQPSQPPRSQVIAPVPGPPVYTVGPWGNPIVWDPMIGFW
jgi:TolA-binding protein